MTTLTAAPLMVSCISQTLHYPCNFDICFISSFNSFFFLFYWSLYFHSSIFLFFHIPTFPLMYTCTYKGNFKLSTYVIDAGYFSRLFRGLLLGFWLLNVEIVSNWYVWEMVCMWNFVAMVINGVHDIGR